jgi:hypothetical protein
LKRPLKFLRKGAVHHVTTRCYHDELRLTPGPAVNLFVESTLIRAARRTGTPIYVGTAMGNHLELLVGESRAGIDKFGEEFIKELSHRLNRMRGVKHSNFPVRYHSTEIGDPEAAERLIARILCNPVRARLVYNVDDWPGFSTLAAHRAADPVLSSPLPSRADAAAFDERHVPDAQLEPLDTVETVLAKPPFWAHLSDEEAHARICELVDAEEAELKAPTASSRSAGTPAPTTCIGAPTDSASAATRSGSRPTRSTTPARPNATKRPPIYGAPSASGATTRRGAFRPAGCGACRNRTASARRFHG